MFDATSPGEPPLARPSDSLDDHTSPPPPELNPLLNPVLSRHLGRWAEVYFTNPPEKREEAVHELLRSLSVEATNDVDAQPLAPAREDTALLRSLRFVDRTEQLRVAPKPVVCASCGAENVAEHRFCGMCGHSLLTAVEPAVAPAAAMEQRAQSPLESESAPQLATPPETQISNAAEFPLGNEHLQRLRDSTERDVTPPESPSFSHIFTRHSATRTYVGAALVVVVGILVYLASRGMQAWSDSPRPVPKAAALKAEQPSAPAAERVETSRKPGTLQRAIEITPSPANAMNAKPGSAAVDRRTIQSASLVETANTGGLAQNLGSGNGSQELLQARSLLGDAQAGAHDSGEAAKWLWKSVGKKNIEATLLLSDLYLKGDGVPQSCDQARLLLDAAARKHSAAAAERLRNLQAFGCQ